MSEKLLNFMCTNVSYATKPTGKSAARVRHAMLLTTASPDGFCKAVLEGRAWMPAVMKGRQVRANWVCQQLIGLDFDNKTDVLGPDGRPLKDENNRVITRFLEPGEPGFIEFKSVFNRLCRYGIAPMFSYDSYSSTPENPRYRVVIMLDERCDDPLVMQEAVDRLLYLFPEADHSCSDLSRFFYGTTPKARHYRVYETFRFYRDTSMATLFELPERPKPAKRQRRAARHGNTAERTNLDELRDNFDLLALIRSDTGEYGRKTGNITKFHQCPICGHKDCFVYYEDTNSWVCFSSSNVSGFTGGSAIDYVMARDRVQFSQAVNELDTFRKYGGFGGGVAS